jgi:hypothetical protein
VTDSLASRLLVELLLLPKNNKGKITIAFDESVIASVDVVVVRGARGR